VAKKKAGGGGGKGSGRDVWSFGGGSADGDGTMKDVLGGKGAGLAEMARIGLPVPAGFTISTGVCAWVTAHRGKYPPGLEARVAKAMTRVEREMGAKFGDRKNPLLVSVRSGAKISMPGMMDTVLNLGMNDVTVEGLAAQSGNPSVVFRKDQPAGLALEWTALVDPSQDPDEYFGVLIAADETT
jgi:pyruvate,orthophosphate dikinase